MTVLIQIEGRQAIPVRAVPLLTNWQFLHPGDLVHVLAGDGGSNVGVFGGANKADRLRSFTIKFGTVAEFARANWKAWLVPKLAALTAQIKQEHPDDAVGYWRWRLESIQALPPGIFVWKDDYQELHQFHWSRQFSAMYCALRGWNGEAENEESNGDVSILMHRAEQLAAAGEFTGLKRDLMEQVRKLWSWKDPNFEPYIDQDGFPDVVMDGFVRPNTAAPRTDAARRKRPHAKLEYVSSGNRMQFEYWLTQDVWTATEVQFLLAGFWPKRGEEPPQYPEINVVSGADAHTAVEDPHQARSYQELLEDAVAAGVLHVLDSVNIAGNPRRYARDVESKFNPAEVIDWATTRRIPAFPYYWKREERDKLRQEFDKPESSTRGPAAPADQAQTLAATVSDRGLGGGEPTDAAAVDLPRVKQSNGWAQLTGQYVRRVYKTGEYPSAATLYRALYDKAGEPDSPFEKGPSKTVVVRETSKRIEQKTLSNSWAAIRKGTFGPKT